MILPMVSRIIIIIIIIQSLIHFFRLAAGLPLPIIQLRNGLGAGFLRDELPLLPPPPLGTTVTIAAGGGTP